MRATIRDRLSLNARAHLTGRANELAVLRQALVQDVPVVIHLHGIPGIGKSALAAAFAEDVRSLSGAALAVECAAVEPTERGLLRELGRLLALLWQFFRFHRYRLRFAFPIRNSYPTDIPRKVPLNCQGSVRMSLGKRGKSVGNHTFFACPG